jgi:hypothetical protein
MADEPVKPPAETPAADPRVNPEAPTETLNQKFLRTAREQVGQYAKGLKERLIGLGEGGDTGLVGGLFGALTTDRRLQGTPQVSVDITPVRASEAIRPVPPITKIQDFTLTWTKIKTNLGDQVDAVLQRSQDETRKAVETTYGILKEKVFGISTSLSTMDRNVKIIDVRTKKFQDESIDTLDKIQKQLAKLSKAPEKGQTFQKVEPFTPEKKEVSVGGGLGGLPLPSLPTAIAAASFAITGATIIGGLVAYWFIKNGLTLARTPDERQQTQDALVAYAMSGFTKYTPPKWLTDGTAKKYYDEYLSKMKLYEEGKGAKPDLRGGVDTGWSGASTEFWKRITGESTSETRRGYESLEEAQRAGQPYKPPPPGPRAGAVPRAAARQTEQLMNMLQRPKWAPGAQQPTGFFQDIGSFFGTPAQAEERPQGTQLIGPSVTATTMGVSSQQVGMAAYNISPHAARMEPMQAGGLSQPGAQAEAIRASDVAQMQQAVAQEQIFSQQGTMFGPGAAGIPARPGVFGLTENVPGALAGLSGLGSRVSTAVGGFFGGIASAFAGGAPGEAGIPAARGAGGAARARGGAAAPPPPPGLTPDQQATWNRLTSQGSIAADDPKAKSLFGNLNSQQLSQIGVEKKTVGRGEQYTITAPQESTLRQEVSAKSGLYRKPYQLTSADLSDKVVNKIAGEIIGKDQKGMDAVIDVALNRIGAKGYQNNSSLEGVLYAPGQFTGYRAQTDAATAALIRERIKAKASGAEPDITKGANEYRAKSYVFGSGKGKDFYQDAEKEGFVNIGDNIYAHRGDFTGGPHAAREQGTPRVTPEQVTPEQLAERRGQVFAERGQKLAGMVAPTPPVTPVTPGGGGFAGGGATGTTQAPVSADVQKARPDYWKSTMSTPWGETVSFGTGGKGRGSLPIGTYDVGYHRAGKIQPGHSFELTGQATFDPKFGGAQRTGLLIHKAYDLGPLKSHGCIAVDQKQYDEFYNHLDSYIKENGPVVLTVNPDGTSRIELASAHKGPTQDTQSAARQNAPVLDPKEASQKIADNGGPTGLGDLRIKTSKGQTKTLSSMGVQTAADLHKAGQAFAGGDTKEGTLYLAQAVQKQFGSGVDRFTAFADDYHKGKGGLHPKGLAADVTLTDKTLAPEVVSYVKDISSKAGIDPKDMQLLDEYARPSSRATAGHVHLGFKTEEAAQKFAEYQKSQEGAEAQVATVAPGETAGARQRAAYQQAEKAVATAAPDVSKQPQPVVPKKPTIGEKLGRELGVGGAHAEERPPEPSVADKKPFDVEATRKDLEEKTKGLKVPEMPAVRPDTEAKVSKAEAAALTEARRKTAGAYPGAQPVSKPAVEKASPKLAPEAGGGGHGGVRPGATAAPAPAPAADGPGTVHHRIAGRHAGPPVAALDRPAPKLAPEAGGGGHGGVHPERKVEKSNPKAGPVEHKGKSEATTTKESKNAQSEGRQPTGGDGGSQSGGGGTSPDRCHFCDEG